MKRREFLQLSGVAGACLLIPTIALDAMAEEPLVSVDVRVGVDCLGRGESDYAFG